MTDAESVVERLLAMANDPEHKNRLAAHEAARTDPWRWYCRLCGATGENADRTVRNTEAYSHVSADGPHQHPTVADAEVGRLLHVWCY